MKVIAIIFKNIGSFSSEFPKKKLQKPEKGKRPKIYQFKNNPSSKGNFFIHAQANSTFSKLFLPQNRGNNFKKELARNLLFFARLLIFELNKFYQFIGFLS